MLWYPSAAVPTTAPRVAPPPAAAPAAAAAAASPPESEPLLQGLVPQPLYFNTVSDAASAPAPAPAPAPTSEPTAAQPKAKPPPPGKESDIYWALASEKPFLTEKNPFYRSWFAIGFTPFKAQMETQKQAQWDLKKDAVLECIKFRREEDARVMELQAIESREDQMFDEANRTFIIPTVRQLGPNASVRQFAAAMRTPDMQRVQQQYRGIERERRSAVLALRRARGQLAKYERLNEVATNNISELKLYGGDTHKKYVRLAEQLHRPLRGLEDIDRSMERGDAAMQKVERYQEERENKTEDRVQREEDRAATNSLPVMQADNEFVDRMVAAMERARNELFPVPVQEQQQQPPQRPTAGLVPGAGPQQVRRQQQQQQPLATPAPPVGVRRSDELLGVGNMAAKYMAAHPM